MQQERVIPLVGVVTLLAFVACTSATETGQSTKGMPELPPEPIVTHLGGDPGQRRVEHGEVIIDVDEARMALHAQHHPHGVLETRRVPGNFEPPAMTEISDFALSKDDLVVINPGPGEYVHVMEGQRRLANTAPFLHLSGHVPRTGRGLLSIATAAHARDQPGSPTTRRSRPQPGRRPDRGHGSQVKCCGRAGVKSESTLRWADGERPGDHPSS